MVFAIDRTEKRSYDSLYYFVKHLREYQLADLDCIPIITSPKGMGKSSLSIQLIRCYANTYGKVCARPECDFYGFKPNLDKCEKCGGELIPFDFDVDPKRWLKTFLAYTVKDFNDKLFALPEYSPLMSDEALRFAMGEDWAAYESKQAKRNLGQIRPRHLLVFMLIPKFRWLDRKYREDMSTFWVRLLKRGQAVVFRPDLGEVDDAYYVNDIQKIMGRYHYFSDTNKLCIKLRKHPCFWGIIHYPKVPERIYTYYMQLRTAAVESKEDAPDLKLNDKQIARVMLWNLKRRFDVFLARYYKQRKGGTDGKYKTPSFNTLSVLARSPLTDQDVLSSGGLASMLQGFEKLVNEAKERGDKNIIVKKEDTYILE